MPRAQPPPHRPVWLIVLAATMLLFGGMTLVGGLLIARDPSALDRQVLRNEARAPAADEAARKLDPILQAIVARHRVGLRVDAIASIAFGVFTLYAVAAVLSRDRNGRLLAVMTAVFGILYQIGELPLKSRIARETFAAAGPLLVELTSAGGQTAARSPAEQIAAVQVVTALVAAVGVGWCVLLLVYFGGRRGRELYGLPRRGRVAAPTLPPPNLPR